MDLALERERKRSGRQRVARTVDELSEDSLTVNRCYLGRQVCPQLLQT
jgi:hypothetical protein